MSLNSSPIDLKTRADELYAQQDYAGAAEAYRRLLEIQPHSAQTMKSLGLALVLNRQAEEGAQICKTAAAMQPTDAEMRYAYGYAMGASNRFDEAIPELDAALNLQPNHVPARQGLIYCLLNAGQAAAAENPHLAEQHLDRARKLDSKNAHINGALLDFYVRTGQKGKAIKLIQGLDDATRRQSPLTEMLAKLEVDGEYATALKQVAVAKQAAPPTTSAPAPVQSLKQVPCPNCKQMIMDYAAICPHCNFRIRATGTFAGHDTGPRYEWQEIAYTIMAIIWCGLSIWDVVAALPTAQKEQFVGPMSFLLILAGARLLVGIGMLFRQEWLAFIAKILCYITLFSSGYGIMLAMGFGSTLGIILNAFQIAVAGFMVYLINYVMGD